MKTITLHLPDKTPLLALRDMAESINCDLRQCPDGSYVARPRDVHTNGNVVKMPRRHKQYMHTSLPTMPEPA